MILWSKVRIRMQKKRILIVEDEGIIALDIRKRLESLGYDVSSVVDSGEKAIEEVRKLRPDLIIMDIVLKGKISGIEASTLIWKILQIPVIYITSSFDEDDQLICKCSNLNYDFIIKPFNQEDFQLKVTQALLQ
jgi:CheY-like chemotaxis protein